MLFAGVEQFLGQLKGGFFTAAAPFYGQLRQAFIQPGGKGGDHHRQAARLQVDRVAALTQQDAFAVLNVVVAKGMPQQLTDELPGDFVWIQVLALLLFGKTFPLGAGNLEAAAVFVTQLQPFGQLIVGFFLCAGFAQCSFFQLVR